MPTLNSRLSRFLLKKCVFDLFDPLGHFSERSWRHHGDIIRFEEELLELDLEFFIKNATI